MPTREQAATQTVLRSFTELSGDDAAWAGAKGAGLAALSGADLPVPPGFVVGAPAFASLCDRDGLRDRLAAVLDPLDVDDAEALHAASARAQALVEQAPLPAEIERQVRHAYATLGGDWEVPVAVRSSVVEAPGETLPATGMHATVLNVRGEDAIIRALRRCWASLFAAPALIRRAGLGLRQSDAAIAVVVQRQVEARRAGVVVTHAPGDADDGRCVIEASRGLGEAAASGAVAPDRWEATRSGTVLRREIRRKNLAVEPLDASGIRTRMLPAEEACAPSLTDAEIARIADLGARIARLRGGEHTTEWALDAVGGLWVLQSRLLPGATIAPRLQPHQPAPNLRDYAAARRGFSWADARGELDGLPGGRGLNIAHEAVDRHARGEHGETTALRWIARDGERRDLSYRELAERTSRFANLLAGLGVAAGSRVASLLGRVPELHVTALGTLKHGSVFCPLFSAFGPEPVGQRLTLGSVRVLVTTPRLYRRRIADQRERLPELAHVLLVGAPDEIAACGAGVADLRALLAAASTSWEIPPTAPDQPALLHFTSGTTGAPKGALHVHEAVVAHHQTGKVALDLRRGDVFWCTADPGWVTGTSYGIVAPLTRGVTVVVDEGELAPDRWYGILQDERVDVWYTAPTAVRMLMRAGAAVAHEYDLSRLRFAASVGEPLDPEAVRWSVEALGQPLHDNWWQTETGGIMIANLRALDVKPGSMGRPLPGIEASILRRDDDGVVLDEHGRAVESAIGEPGELALRPGWPSMFRGYLDEPERYERCFAGGWYLTGDLARRDLDGCFWFVGRGDDLIKSSGHLIGPFEVESALLEHPAVAEAGVIGVPDAVAGQLVKAFVAVAAGHEASPALARELIGFARTRLGPAVAPREVAFVAAIPKNRSGKIVRRLLRARELGLPEGDLSTLEEGR
ncbi:MAG TPA: acetate--CoA ligase [Conexibacter sp.]|nr:acetate--CoA ligase [Conexibacter sp.]